MKKSFFHILILVLLFSFGSNIYANGLSLNSIGSRALGMGGAFVGLADDHTAIYWNPAGLYQQKGAYVGVFVTDIIPTGTYTYDAAQIDTKTLTNHYISPNVMGYWQCLLTDKLKMGLGIYVPAGLGAEWDGNDLKAFSNGSAYNWMSKIGVVNISPAVSFALSDQLSLGAAVNVYYAMFDMERPATLRDQTGQVVGFAQYSESSTGLGYGITFGALFQVNKMISVGASFRTKTNVTMSGEAENPGMAAAGVETKSDFDRDVAWPMWIAGGVAVRPTDNLTFTFDLQWSQWSASEETFKTEFKNATWAAGAQATGDDTFKLFWEDALQIRLGAEYKLNDAFTLRGGYYNDPAPAPDKTYNILFPSISYNAFTAGGTMTFGNVNIDAGFEYLLGSEREIPTGKYEDAVPGTHNMNIFAFSIGAGFSF